MDLSGAIVVRPCAAADVPVLEQHARVTGRALMVHRWFSLQGLGELTYLVAWIGRVPVGHVCIRWAGRPDGEVQQRFPNVPELVALDVYPPELRGHGAGGRLIEAALTCVRERSGIRAGMAVPYGDDAAVALCVRFGFVDWGHGPYRSSWKDRDYGGRTAIGGDVVTYFVKDLAA